MEINLNLLNDKGDPIEVTLSSNDEVLQFFAQQLYDWNQTHAEIAESLEALVEIAEDFIPKKRKR